jgi:hypothetical protein
MKRFFKEPLLHFLLIGAAFFLLYSWVGEKDLSQNTIVIDESDLDEIVSKFEMQWKRNPTEEELTAIVEKRIEEEVFYQEALKMNLDHNDEIIKRRLAQKMQFLSNDISTMVQPKDDELKSYYSKHPDKYIAEAKYTLYQVFFSPDQREDFKGDANRILEQIKNVSFEQALQMGDEISLPNYFESTSAFHLSRQMGNEFTVAISDLKTGTWQGPISSGYGVHLIFIEAKLDPQLTPFDDVRNKVLEDYNHEHQKEVKASILSELEKNYQIEFDVKSEFYSAEFISKMRNQITGE